MAVGCDAGRDDRVPEEHVRLALNLERDSVGTVILGDYEHITEGDTVKCTGASWRSGRARADGSRRRCAGQPIDARAGQREGDRRDRKVAPGVIWRQSVAQPVQTAQVDRRDGADRSWTARVDHRGPADRQDRGSHRYDHQPEGKDLFCIYVAIGQKASSIMNVVKKLEEHGAMSYTIVVAASASESAAMQYIAPYSGCTMGEYFRDPGRTRSSSTTI